ncbi:unnamed protein product [Sphenostylis stenocarpa]|uniref:Uncharacterized protein n=1 Tax=Sphenostylis stenocarpa TaxID=92480 RepID=A0AA86RSG0_9FABA|nr:unnamed protein product [Sphenostylis stenocarpa]
MSPMSVKPLILLLGQNPQKTIVKYAKREAQTHAKEALLLITQSPRAHFSRASLQLTRSLNLHVRDAHFIRLDLFVFTQIGVPATSRFLLCHRNLPNASTATEYWDSPLSGHLKEENGKPLAEEKFSFPARMSKKSPKEFTS